jgi:hypothetical protein
VARVLGIAIGAGDDLTDQRQIGAAGEHREAPEHDLLALVEQAVAPLERGAQRALARRR